MRGEGKQRRDEYRTGFPAVNKFLKLDALGLCLTNFNSAF